MSIGILIVAIILLFMIAYFLVGGSTEEVSYVESSDKYNAGFAHNNIIYQLAGYGGYGSKKLYIIDYVKGKVLDEIIWKEPLLYQQEQEQCTPYGDDGILINYNGANYISYVKFLNWRF